uniref:Uncharacterized protein n=1 Tax=Arundo donax TaxID=35708 RepID=A0A0A9B6L7_ARUDO
MGRDGWSFKERIRKRPGGNLNCCSWLLVR